MAHAMSHPVIERDGSSAAGIYQLDDIARHTYQQYRFILDPEDDRGSEGTTLRYRDLASVIGQGRVRRVNLYGASRSPRLPLSQYLIRSSWVWRCLSQTI